MTTHALDTTKKITVTYSPKDCTQGDCCRSIDPGRYELLGRLHVADADGRWIGNGYEVMRAKADRSLAFRQMDEGIVVPPTWLQAALESMIQSSGQ